MSTRQIKVFSTPTCPYCQRAKIFLNDNQIEYLDFNVAEDRFAREELVNEYQQLSVPVIVIDEEVIVGFDEARLKKKLGIK